MKSGWKGKSTSRRRKGRKNHTETKHSNKWHEGLLICLGDLYKDTSAHSSRMVRIEIWGETAGNNNNRMGGDAQPRNVLLSRVVGQSRRFLDQTRPPLSPHHSRLATTSTRHKSKFALISQDFVLNITTCNTASGNTPNTPKGNQNLVNEVGG